AFSFGPVLKWRCASMKPGMADMPLASIVCPLVAAGRPADADTILPSRTTIEPRSMTEASGPMMRTLVIVRFCADAGIAARSAERKTAEAVEKCRVMSPRGRPEGLQLR